MQRQQPANTIRKCCSVAKGVLLQMKRTIQTKQLHANETKTHRSSRTAQVVQPYTPLHLVQTNLTRVYKTPKHTINHVFDMSETSMARYTYNQPCIQTHN